MEVSQGFPRIFLTWLVASAFWLAGAVGNVHGAENQASTELESIYWYQGKIIASVVPRANEGYIQLSRRILADPARYPQLAKFNKQRTIQRNRAVHVPLPWLRASLRGIGLRKLYPDDDLTERGWAHRVTDPLENLIQLTESYTGSKARFKELAAYNNLRNPNVLRLSTQITIPLHWIPEALGFGPSALKKPLKLEKDGASGKYFARYKVARNDTLYSLIIRFTDRERAAEINRMSKNLAYLNKVDSPNRVRAGRVLRIPLEWISEEFILNRLKPGLKPPKPAPVKNPVAAQPLHVIVDPGHGGTDPGAVYGSRKKGNLVYEHEVVFDIALRLEKRLRTMGHQVYRTISDAGQDQPRADISIKALGGERVRVTPPYRMDSANIAVNMRVFLINAIYKNLVRKGGVASENILLISIHGDALAPTLRGAMVYFPDHRLRGNEFGPGGRVYRIRQEAVQGLIRFKPAQNRTAHTMSKRFAALVIKYLRNQGAAISPRKPVRSYYYRDGERTLPAVLRYSLVPTSVLVEVANLNNTRDRQDMLKGAVRERVATGIGSAIAAYHRSQPALAKAR